MNLEDFMLGEISQSQEDEYCIVPLLQTDGKQNGGCQGPVGRGDGGATLHGDRASVWEDGKVLKVDGGDGHTTM